MTTNAQSLDVELRSDTSYRKELNRLEILHRHSHSQLSVACNEKEEAETLVKELSSQLEDLKNQKEKSSRFSYSDRTQSHE